MSGMMDTMRLRHRLKARWRELIMKLCDAPSMSVNRRTDRDEESKTVAMLVPGDVRERLDRVQQVYGCNSFAHTAQVAMLAGLAAMEGTVDRWPPPLPPEADGDDDAPR